MCHPLSYGHHSTCYWVPNFAMSYGIPFYTVLLGCEEEYDEGGDGTGEWFHGEGG